MKRYVLASLIALSAASLWAQPVADSPFLYGIHWYGNTDAIGVGQLTDVETMTGSKGIWVLEHALTDSAAAAVAPWEQPWQASPLDKRAPGYKVFHSQKATSGKGHSLIFRLQPFWNRNVPHASDPYTLAAYSDDCSSAAYVLRDYCHIWVIGNEVNLFGENNRWDGTAYQTFWQPTPAEYAATYLACRDKIHGVTANTNPSNQIVLMQPVSPGNADTARFMDGNEFLYRQIEAVADKSKIDGFALHGYAEPGASDFGVKGFWDSIREQLMIIDSFGLGDRPVYITEWNKHMPNETEVQIGAKFLSRAFAKMNAWNTGSGGEWPGLANHNVVTATWFVYPADDGTWKEYSLVSNKKASGGTIDNDPWLSFQYACTQNYARGASGGGPTAIAQDKMWWRDTFDGSSLDGSSPLPEWKDLSASGGSVAMSGDGAVRLLGNSSPFGQGSIQTAGYVYGNFRLESDIEVTDASRSSASATPEANIDIRVREGSQGYSLTFFTSGCDSTYANRNHIVLRRTSEWSQIGSFNALVSDGINTGDKFHLSIVANGSTLTYKITKNGNPTPVVDWTVNDSAQKVGWIRFMTYNLQEARVADMAVGGPAWVGGTSADAKDWALFE